jgi:hypothetical protein
VAVEKHGDFDYFFPQAGAKVSVAYEVAVISDQEPAEADVSKCDVYKTGVAEADNLVSTHELLKTGSGDFNLDIADLDPRTDSPLLLEFTFSKDVDGDTREVKAQLMLALALPAVSKIEATPASGVQPGGEVTLKVIEWGALVFDRPGEQRLQGKADDARFPSGAKDATAWEKRIGQRPARPLDGTGPETTYALAEGEESEELVFRAHLNEQHDRPTANVFGAGWPAKWATKAYVDARKQYRQDEVAAAQESQSTAAAA